MHDRKPRPLDAVFRQVKHRARPEFLEHEIARKNAMGTLGLLSQGRQREKSGENAGASAEEERHST